MMQPASIFPNQPNGTVIQLHPNPELTSAESTRAQSLLNVIASQALKKILKQLGCFDVGNRNIKIIEAIFQQTIEYNYQKLIKAAKLKPSAHNAVSHSKRSKARKDLADELRSGRKRLRELQNKITRADRIAEETLKEYEKEKRTDIAQRIRVARMRLKQLTNAFTEKSIEWVTSIKPIVDEMSLGRKYPDVPLPFVIPSKEGFNIPEIPGIYFLWDGDTIIYVGQSIRLCNRLRIGSHHILKSHHQISFLPFEIKKLTWAECYYIGALRPQQNYGQKATHYESVDD